MSEEILTLDHVEEMPGRVIDVMVWGASRPHIFRRTIEAFKANVSFSGRLRFFLEDGAFNEARAAESAAIAQGHGFDGVHVERVGSYGWAMTHAINRWQRAPLMFSLEDDWLCLRPIDLDLGFDAFEQNPWLNQLRYNRRKNESEIKTDSGPYLLAQRALVINGAMWPVVGGAHWYFGPALWRMSYARPRWRGAYSNVHFYTNSANGFLPRDLPPHSRPPPEWYADTLGAVTWGPVKEPPFFEHIGRADSIHAAQGRV